MLTFFLLFWSHTELDFSFVLRTRETFLARLYKTYENFERNEYLLGVQGVITFPQPNQRNGYLLGVQGVLSFPQPNQRNGYLLREQGVISSAQN